jgi:hypothetical protein
MAIIFVALLVDGKVLMAIIDTMPALHLIDKLRGVLDFYVLCRGGPAKTIVVRKWPTTPKLNLTQRTIAAQKPFAQAVKAATQVSQETKDLYTAMAGDTSYTWKDIAISIYLKGSMIYKES